MHCEEWIARRLPALWRLLNASRLGVEGPLFRGGAVCRGPATGARIALTFDDGPDPRWTPTILDILETNGASATFFFLGAAVQRCPQLARRAADRHEIGTHLYTHSREIMRDRLTFEADLSQALGIHRQVLGIQPTLLRFPFGYAGRARSGDLRLRGITPCHWTFSSLDSRTDIAQDVVRRVCTRLAPGAIVLLHDGRGENSTYGPGHRQATVEALPRILAFVRQRGLEAVTVSQLLGPLGRES